MLSSTAKITTPNLPPAYPLKGAHVIVDSGISSICDNLLARAHQDIIDQSQQSNKQRHTHLCTASTNYCK